MVENPIADRSLDLGSMIADLATCRRCCGERERERDRSDKLSQVHYNMHVTSSIM
ncbi:hypothetical protein PRUPE_8G061200 [Prunus persica]|uniref:Uncharacterized protein n=1 Tax=Prunus persica TaxID=3760 RepID=A0A251MU03_PRUPE|nr:hypothetical protein PRUPE_8G061200 [Prunus persica]